MGEPKKVLETAMFSLLDGDVGITWDVFNTRATGSAFSYVVFQAVGGGDEEYHRKKRGYVYEYQVVGIHTDRSTALDMAVAIEAAMGTAAATLSVAGHGVVRVTRTEPVDYVQVTEDGVSIYYVGGVYQIELEEV